MNTTVLDAEAAPWWQLAASPPTPKPLSQPELPILGVGSLMMRITSYGPAAGHPSYFPMILNLPYLPTYLTYFPLHHVPHILYADTTLGPTSPHSRRGQSSFKHLGEWVREAGAPQGGVGVGRVPGRHSLISAAPSNSTFPRPSFSGESHPSRRTPEKSHINP